MALKFTAHTCAPDWEDYVGMTGDDNTAYTDWDIIERKLGKWGYPHMESAGRILGYASLIQNGIAEACESKSLPANGFYFCNSTVSRKKR